MTEAELDAYMDAAAVALGLTIAPAWRGEVAANLRVLFAQGARVQGFALSEEAEPAPVFRA